MTDKIFLLLSAMLPTLVSAAILVFALIVSVVVVDMFFPFVLGVIQRVTVIQYVLSDVLWLL